MEILEQALTKGIGPTAIIAILLIVMKLIEMRKDSSTVKISADVAKSFNKLSEHLMDVTKGMTDRERDKCKSAIEDSLFSSGMRLVSFVSSTIVNNHIDENRDTILLNIKNIVNSEFYTMFSTLSMYKVNGVIASDFLNKDWMVGIEKDMIDIIYNMKLNKEDKILSFSNKITIRFQSYITYVINNVIR